MRDVNKRYYPSNDVGVFDYLLMVIIFSVVQS